MNTRQKDQLWNDAPRPEPAGEEDPFVRRRWLEERIKRFVDDPAGRHLLLVGRPGWGKSAFLAQMAAAVNAPLHVIRAGHKDGVSGRGPRDFILSIGAQLYQKYGKEIFPRAESSTTVATAFAGQGATITGRIVDVLYELPFLPLEQHDVKVVTGVIRRDAVIIGEKIRVMANISAGVSEEDLLGLAVLAPIRRLQELRPHEPVMIFIDAIDEAAGSIFSADASHTQVKTILEVIPRADDTNFPSNLRIVMTSRYGDQLVAFREQDILQLKDFDALNRDDASAYVKAHFSRSPITEALAALDVKRRASLTSRIATRSEGNFLYLHHFFAELKRHIREAKGDLTTLPVPKGIDEIYRFFAIGKIRKAARRDEWRLDYVPLLGILAVAREALDADQLSAYAGVDLGKVEDLVAEIRQFLEIDSMWHPIKYRLFHGDFADYLLDPKRNRNFRLHGPVYHETIAAHYRKMATVGDHVDWRSLQDEYAFNHLATHLSAAGNVEGLHKLVTSHDSEIQWARAHFDRGGSYLHYLRDLDLAWESSETRRMTSRTVLYALFEASIRNHAGLLPPSLLAALVTYEVWPLERALAVCRTSHDPWLRAQAFVKVVRVPLSLGLAFDDRVFDEVLDAIELHPRAEFRGRLLAQVVSDLPIPVLERAEAIAVALPDEPDRRTPIEWGDEEEVTSPRSEAVVALIFRLTELGRKEEALALIPLLRGKYGAKTMDGIAPRLAAVDVQRIKAIADSMSSKSTGTAIVAAIAYRLETEEPSVHLEHALAAALEEPQYGDRAEALTAIAPYLGGEELDRGLNEALATLKTPAVVAFAQRNAEEGRGLEALRHCRDYWDYGFWWKALPAVAHMLNEAQKEPLFREVLNHLHATHRVDKEFARIIRALPESLIDEALAIDRSKLNEPYYTDLAWIERLGRAGRVDEAVRRAYADDNCNLRLAVLPYLRSPAEKNKLLSSALGLYSAIDDVVEHAQALTTISRDSAIDLSQDILATVLKRTRDWHADRVLRLLSARLTDPDQLAAALGLARQLPGGVPRVRLGSGPSTDARISALARLARQFTAQDRRSVIDEILGIVRRQGAAEPGRLMLYRRVARAALEKHLPDEEMPAELVPRKAKLAASSPTEPVRVVDGRTPPAEAYAEAQSAIAVLGRAPISAEGVADLVNAYRCVRGITDDELKNKALRMLAPFWRLARLAADDDSPYGAFWSIAEFIPDQDVAEAVQHAPHRKDLYIAYKAYYALLARLAKIDADRFNQVWSNLLREAARSGRPALLSELPWLINTRSIVGPAGLPREATIYIDLAVRLWP